MLALSNIFTGSSLGGPQQREVSDVFYVCGLAAVLVVAGAARFYGISELPLWMDEAYTYFVATRPLHDIVFNELDNHPPLFYALQHFWLLSFPNITAFRFPAAAIGSITAIVVALATSDLVNRQAGLAAGAEIDRYQTMRLAGTSAGISLRSPRQQRRPTAAAPIVSNSAGVDKCQTRRMKCLRRFQESRRECTGAHFSGFGPARKRRCSAPIPRPADRWR
jgi:hypothetical protein